eukprot:11364110-Ditylum_brightwellii.AAC.1
MSPGLCAVIGRELVPTFQWNWIGHDMLSGYKGQLDVLIVLKWNMDKDSWWEALINPTSITLHTSVW